MAVSHIGMGGRWWFSSRSQKWRMGGVRFVEAKGRGRHFEVTRMIITFIYCTVVIWNFIVS